MKPIRYAIAVATARSLAPGRGNFLQHPALRPAPERCRFALPDAVPSRLPRRLWRRKTADGDSAGLQDAAEEEDVVVGVRGAAGRREQRRRPGHIARRRRVDEDGIVAIDELGTGSLASQAPPRPSPAPVPSYAPPPPPLTVSPGSIPRCLARSHPALCCLAWRLLTPELPRVRAPPRLRHHTRCRSTPRPPPPRSSPPRFYREKEKQMKPMATGREEEIKERREDKRKKGK
jgi:hypothetical protein